MKKNGAKIYELFDQYDKIRKYVLINGFIK